jgi:hypothetical protein
VNPTGENTEVDPNVAGADGLDSAMAIVLQGSPDAENSICNIFGTWDQARYEQATQ